MTVKEAARRLEVSVQQVYKLCKIGRLPHSRVGEKQGEGPIRISEEDLREFQKTCRVTAPATTLHALKHIEM